VRLQGVFRFELFSTILTVDRHSLQVAFHVIFNDISRSFALSCFTTNCADNAPVSSDLNFLRLFLLHFYLGGSVRRRMNFLHHRGILCPCCCLSSQLDFSLLHFLCLSLLPRQVGETLQLVFLSNTQELLQLLLKYSESRTATRSDQRFASIKGINKT